LKIGTKIHRIGDDSTVNAYLIDDGGAVSVIDAAMPGYYDDIPRELAAMGRSIGDVRGAGVDPRPQRSPGLRRTLRTEQEVPVWIEEIDAPLARGEQKARTPMGKIRFAPLLGFLWLGLRNGGLRQPRVLEVSTFGDDATLDVPGSPRVVLVPGHTPGSAALSVPSLGALFVGDALATYAVTSGRRGPQIAPFTADRRQALESLKRLDGIEAGLVLPGHGEPWTGGVEEAVRQVQYSADGSGQQTHA
jgi:glyoxylase-like metal-dependent hydrolase (beta-lactamase superfamily II)